MASPTPPFRAHVEELEAREVLDAAQSLNPAILQVLASYLPSAHVLINPAASGFVSHQTNDHGLAAQLPRQVEHRLEITAKQIFNRLDDGVRNNLFNQVNNVTNRILNRLEPQVQGNVLNQINTVGNGILNRPNNNEGEINRLTILNNVTSNVLNSINKEFGNGNNDTRAPNNPAPNNPLANASVQYSGASPLNF